MHQEYSYWEVWFISCESNRRWTIVRTPSDWTEWDVRNRIPNGGCDDDPAEILSISETQDEDFCWDFTLDESLL